MSKRLFDIRLFDIIQNANTGILPGTDLREHKYTLKQVRAIIYEAIRELWEFYDLG